MRKMLVTFSLGLAATLVAQPARGDLTLGFGAITANSVSDVAIGESQLQVMLSSAGANQVLFRFDNLGPAASSITDVYFDDGTLLGIASISSSSGVSFSQGASPPELPSAQNASPPFVTTVGFLADSDAPALQANGVNPGEWLGITFNLINGQTLADTEAALLDGSLRIGMHVQGFDGGGSESFVNEPPPVPAPGALLLGAMGLGLVGGLRRRA